MSLDPPRDSAEGAQGARPQNVAKAFARAAAVWGPGLLVMLADTDAGNVVTAADAGARYGYRLAPLILMLIPALFLLQDLALRLGLATGQGLGRLIGAHTGGFGRGVAGFALVSATLSSLVTEFSGIAGVGEMYGLPRGLMVGVAAALLIGVALTGEYRRIERVALMLGLFEAAFFFVSWKTHPSFAAVLADAADPPLRDPQFLYLAAGLIGATFNPWMVFYQTSAVVEKGLTPDDYPSARADTLVGALVTQGLTASILVAVAASVSGPRKLGGIGEIADALTPWLGAGAGRAVFAAGVIGAAMAAAIVASMACAWGLSELRGGRERPEASALRNRGFRAFYFAAVLGAAALALEWTDLVRLSIAMQALNAVLLPGVGALVLYVGRVALPANFALSRGRFAASAALLGLCALAGLVGAFAGLL